MTVAYDLLARKTYNRPQAMIWSDRKFSYTDSTAEYLAPVDLDEEMMQAIVLPDHGRAPLNLGVNRIESRNRMINGTSRAFWTADKRTLSTSWENLPSRLAEFGMTWVNGMQVPEGPMFLADNAAPAQLIKMWHEAHPEPFYVYLSYDDAKTDKGGARLLQRYVDEKRMYFTSFNYTIGKRGIYDFVNIDVALEEV